jgi:membrane protease YdiL (CAAX protease family)
MIKGLFSNASPFSQLILLAFIMMACLLLFMLIGILFAPLLLGLPLTELTNVFNGNTSVQNINVIRYIQVLSGIGLFIIPAFIASWLFSGTATGYLNFDFRKTRKSKFNLIKWFGAVLLLMLMAIPCINMLAALNEMIVFPKSMSGLEQWLKAFEEAAQELTESFLKVDNIGGMLFNIFMMAFLPALGEELIFRGLLQKIFIRWTGSIHVGIIITGFLFSLMHMQFYGFFPRWLLGVMFGYLLVWSGTIWLPIFAHFVNNAVAVFLSFLIHKGIVPENIETFGSDWHDITVTIMAAIICTWLLWIMYRRKIDPEFISG